MSACFWAIVTPTFRRLVGLSPVLSIFVATFWPAVVVVASSISDAMDWSDFLFLLLGGIFVVGVQRLLCRNSNKEDVGKNLVERVVLESRDVL